MIPRNGRICSALELEELMLLKCHNPKIQFSSVPQTFPILCNRIDYSMPGFLVHHQLPELAQTHVH